MSVFKDRYIFNRKIGNGKRHVKIFPKGGDPTILPRKISFHGNIKRDALFAEKVVSCYKCKTRNMLGENCPVASPNLEDSAMSFSEQSDTPLVNQNPVQPDPYAEAHPQGESSKEPSSPTEGADREVPSGKDSNSA